MLIKIDDRTWINPYSIDYISINSDGNAVVGCGGESFEFYTISAQTVIDTIQTALTIEEAFSKVKT